MSDSADQAEAAMFAWGKAAAAGMHAYPQPAGLVDSLWRANLVTEVVYLTSGWTPFIAGVVDDIRRRTYTEDVPFSIVGSTMTSGASGWRTSALMDGAAKADWIERQLETGTRIELLADDQHHDILPFDRVRDLGGQIFKIAYRGENHDPWDGAVDD